MTLDVFLRFSLGEGMRQGGTVRIGVSDIFVFSDVGHIWIYVLGKVKLMLFKAMR